jgi:hypothetical protein
MLKEIRSTKMKKLKTKIMIVCLISILFSSCGPKGTEWQGRIEEVNGVTVVYNPEEPLSKDAGRVIQLTEELRISDNQGDFYFKWPSNIKIAPDGSIFIEDEDQFLRFDRNGQFIANLFTKGQGPGELENIINYLFDGNEILILQSRPNKIVRMDMSGKFISEFRPESMVSEMFTRFGDKLIAAHSSFPKLEKAGEEPEIIDIKWNLKRVTEDGKVDSTALEFPVKWYAQRLEKAIIANYIVNFTARPFLDRFLVIKHTQEYMLKLLELESQKIVRAFTREYDRVRYKPDETGRVEISPGSFTLVPPVDHLNDIQKLFVQDEAVWAMTSTVDEEKGFLVDVFNRNGEYTDNFYLPVQNQVKVEGLSRHPITVSGDTLLIVEYDADGIPSVVKYRMKGL